MAEHNLILPPLNYDPAVVDSPLRAIGGVTSRQAIEAEVDEQLKLFDFQRYIQLQRAKQTEEPIYSPDSVDPYSGEPELLGYRKTPKKVLSAEDANRKYGLPKDGLTFNEPITEEAAIIIRKRKESELYNQRLLSEASGWTTTKAFGMGLATSLVQPEQIVANVIGSLIAAPIYGAKFTPAVLEAMSVSRRLAARAKIGAVEGLVGSVVAEPIQMHFADEEHADYTLWNTLTNLAAGTILGSGLHVVGGVGADWVNGLRAKTWQDGLNTAVKQLLEGRQVEVTPIVHNDPGVIARNTPTDNILLTPSRTPPLPEVQSPDDAALVASVKQSIANMPTEVTDPNDLAKLKQAIDSGRVEVSIDGNTVTVNGKKFTADKKSLFGEKVESTESTNAELAEQHVGSGDYYALPNKHTLRGNVLVAIRAGNGLLNTSRHLDKMLESLQYYLDEQGYYATDLAYDMAKYLLKNHGIMVKLDKKVANLPYGTLKSQMPVMFSGEVIRGSVEDFGLTDKYGFMSHLANTDASYIKHQKEIMRRLDEMFEADKPSMAKAFLDANKQVAKLDDNLVQALAGQSISNTEPEVINQNIMDIGEFSPVEQTSHLSSSNPGMIWVNNTTGEPWFIKKNKSNQHSVVEYIANRFYKALGVDVADNILIRDGEDLLLGSRLITYGQPFNSHTATVNELQDALTFSHWGDSWVVDAWLANWDALVAGNVVLDVNGTPYRIDHGGALLYRAQGAPKGDQFSAEMDELTSIPEHNKLVRNFLADNGIQIFSNKPALDDLYVYLNNNPYVTKIVQMSPGEVHSIVQESGLLDEATANVIASKLIARQADLVHKMQSVQTVGLVPENSFYAYGKRIFTKTKAAGNWLKDKAVSLFDKYTDKEKSAIEDYQGSSSDLNAFLRNAAKYGGVDSYLKQYPSASSDYLLEKVRHLDSAMKVWQTDHPMQVFRWTHLSWYGFDKGKVSELIGAKYWDPGYASTSIFKNNTFADRDLLLTINLPAGQNAALADAWKGTGTTNFSKDEAEIILPRDMHYVIRSAEEVNGKVHMTLDVLPDKIAGMDLHEAVTKAMAWQKEKSLAAQGVKQLSQEEVDQYLADLSVKTFDSPPTLTEKVLSQQEKNLNELIATLERNISFEFPDSADELAGIIDTVDTGIKEADAYSKAMLQAAICYTRV